MSNKVLNITNGDAFNRYFQEKFGGVAVPFREVMMDGDVVEDIFSCEFVRLRAKELNVSEETYRENMLLYDAMSGGEFFELCLWFGKDTFCQMNLLATLSFLEQIGYGGAVKLNYIDDETFDTVEENIVVELGIYREIYRAVLIEGRIPSNVGVLCLDAINLYFDYRSESGKLAQTVKRNRHLDEHSIMCILLQNSKEYGLSDLQAAKLIEKYK